MCKITNLKRMDLVNYLLFAKCTETYIVQNIKHIISFKDVDTTKTRHDYLITRAIN